MSKDHLGQSTFPGRFLSLLSHNWVINDSSYLTSTVFVWTHIICRISCRLLFPGSLAFETFWAPLCQEEEHGVTNVYVFPWSHGLRIELSRRWVLNQFLHAWRSIWCGYFYGSFVRVYNYTLIYLFRSVIRYYCFPSWFTVSTTVKIDPIRFQVSFELGLPIGHSSCQT